MRNQVLFGLCLLPSVVMAKDTIWLDNGDRIVGDIVFKSDDHIVVNTAYAGRINIDWEHVATLETEAPITVVVEGVATDAVSKLDVFENGSVICKKCATPIIALKDIDTLVYPTPWNGSLRSEGHVDLAANFERRNNDIDEYNLDGEVRLYHGKWRHELNGESERKSEDDTTSKNKWNAKYSIDRFFGEHLYFRTAAEYLRDYHEDVYRARTYSAGPGYLFWDDKLRRLDISIAYGNIHFWVYDADIDFGYELSFNAAQLTWDFQHALFGDRLSFYMKGDIAEPDTGFVELIADTEQGFRYRINDWLSAKISYQVDDIKTRFGDSRSYQTRVGVGANW